MEDGVSRDEFSAFCDRLYKTQDAGFKGIHDRLDVLNGRTGKGELERERMRGRIILLEKELSAHPRRRMGEADAKGLPLMTKRETALVVVGLTVIASSIKLMLVVGEFALAFLKASVGKP